MINVDNAAKFLSNLRRVNLFTVVIVLVREKIKGLIMEEIGESSGMKAKTILQKRFNRLIKN